MTFGDCISQASAKIGFCILETLPKSPQDLRPKVCRFSVLPKIRQPSFLLLDHDLPYVTAYAETTKTDPDFHKPQLVEGHGLFFSFA
jgi:hypothetical protein